MNIRIDNIECRFLHNRYDIVKWYPNTYYGTEEKLMAEGYKRTEYADGMWILTKDYHTISSSCFANKESCYSIAFLEYHKDDKRVNMITIDSRVLDLKKKDRKAFFQVYKIADVVVRYQNKNKK